MLSIAVPAWSEAPPSRAISAELTESAMPGQSFVSLYGALQQAAALPPTPAPEARFSSWEMKEWVAEAPAQRRARRPVSEQAAELSDRGRELVVLGLAWLGRLAGGH